MEYGFAVGNSPMMMPMGNGPQRKPWKEQVVERGWAACTIVPTSFQADGGHEPGPNWPYFLDLFDLYVVKK